MAINIEELQKICVDFFRLTEMGFSLWDENRRNIFSYPTSHQPFCMAVRSEKSLSHKCPLSDKIGLDEVDKTKMPYVYTCHMGLTEAIVPILQDEEIVGYLMMGQIVEDKNRDKILERIDKTVKDEKLKKSLVETLPQNVQSNSDKIGYCINILKVMIDYMNLSYVISKTNETVSEKAKKYVISHMSLAVLPKDICKAIGVSINTLYKSVKNTYGKSTTEFIRSLKMEEAKRLLESSNEGICFVAEKVGIPDVNYFIRVFKKEVGVSPLKYR